MALEGKVYYAGSAYSYYNETNNLAGLCAAVGGAPVGGGANRQAARGAHGAARRVNGTAPARSVNSTGPVRAVDGTAPAAGARKPRRVVSRRGPMSRQGPSVATDDAVETAANAAVATANVHNNYYARDYSTETKLVTTVVKRDIYVGEATIILGVITAMAGQQKERWEEGEFEYVPNYTLEGTEGVNPVKTALDASYPWIRDKSYRLTFHRSIETS